MFFGFIQTAHAAEGAATKLTPYVVGQLGGLPITATLLSVWLTMTVLVIMAFLVGRNLKTVPGKVQSIFEVVIGGAYDQMAELLESKELARKYFPIVMTIFLFILIMNWMGLMPWVNTIGFYDEHNHLTPFFYPPATDLNVTIGFALVAFLVIEFAGITTIGLFKYAGKFINLKFFVRPNFNNFIGIFVGLIELISEIARLLSFSFRLFGNIFAGKVLLGTIMALAITPYVIPVPVLAYELIVGFIQAAIFALLTVIFIKIAVDEPH